MAVTATNKRIVNPKQQVIELFCSTSYADANLVALMHEEPKMKPSPLQE
jgi:hypothetical protein